MCKTVQELLLKITQLILGFKMNYVNDFFLFKYIAKREKEDFFFDTGKKQKTLH